MFWPGPCPPSPPKRKERTSKTPQTLNSLVLLLGRATVPEMDSSLSQPSLLLSLSELSSLVSCLTLVTGSRKSICCERMEREEDLVEEVSGKWAGISL